MRSYRWTSLRESLALFGYPISKARMEVNASGDRVLLGRLGAELRGERGR